MLSKRCHLNIRVALYYTRVQETVYLLEAERFFWLVGNNVVGKQLENRIAVGIYNMTVFIHRKRGKENSGNMSYVAIVR